MIQGLVSLGSAHAPPGHVCHLGWGSPQAERHHSQQLSVTGQLFITALSHQSPSPRGRGCTAA